MENAIQSIVIVTGKHGYVASLRFANRFLDVDIAATFKERLYRLIDDYLANVGVRS